MSLIELRNQVKSLANAEVAKTHLWFFKTGKGEYGGGDKFVGLKVPTQRKIAKVFLNLNYGELSKLLASKIHEERLIALLILVERYAKSNERDKEKIFKFYLKNRKGINNWDLVDLSAPKIIGEQLVNKNRKILFELAKSNNLWERRIAILSTLAFIKRADFNTTLQLSVILLNDEHDLIHKAVGWMLREIGKKTDSGGLKVEEDFLKLHYKKMPRTMLRYAIEKFSESKRKKYLSGKI
ncbi:MAG: DNA alkylation repair protein [Ignavibacteria bacterium]|nr:DNA alkylation repair protein [Ignavibacteria bacterium]MBT8381019.1 DNA alkylation repair protein [Ignavibacteria bacterium]MBT8390525.1 DNA alkylation repair protein [Ignavibacteria bacterium]NNJ51780.1 DNA alkylation repair protein [Ignavibacteriaceae bacterium]NNL22788.1 DNA alkylation repair protein [Ignavibacteriaceae bacterium]